MGRMITSIIAALVLCFSVFCVMWAAEFDPQSLVGEWRGTWSYSALSDDIFITIKSVSGSEVVGTVYVKSRARYAYRDMPSKGTVSFASEAATLILTNEHFTLTLNLVSSKEMTGTGVGNQIFQVQLQKAK